MKRRFCFAPTLNSLTLEERVVLSHSPVPTQIVNAYVREFRTQLDGVSTGIQTAVTQTLLGGNNSTPTTQSRADYDTQVSKLVQNAETVLDDVLALSPLAKQKFTAQINQLLTGSDSASLISRLNALTTPTATGAPVETFTADSEKLVTSTLRQSLVDLDLFFSEENPLREAIENNTPLTLQSSYDTQFTAAFTTFSTSYSNDVTNILLTGTDPANIPTNRTAFNTQVGVDANLLNSDLANMLSLFPNATKELTKSINDRLISGTNSMLDQLNALASPTDLNGTSAQAFRTQATSIINQAQTDVLGLLNTAFKGWKHAAGA